MESEKRLGIRRKSRGIVVAGALLVGFCSVLPLKASQEADAGFQTYEQEKSGPDDVGQTQGEQTSVTEEQEAPSIRIDIHPMDAAVDVGGSVTFTTAASVAGDLTATLLYEWQESADGSHYYTVGNGPFYWLSDVQAERNGHYFRCLVTGDAPDLEPQMTDAARLTVRVPNYTVTVENGQADPVSAAPGSTVWITANEPSEREEFQEWTVKEGEVTLAGPTNSRTFFTMPGRNVRVTAVYQAAVGPPHIDSEPEDVQVEAGGYASFGVSVSGEELTYQWLVDKGDGSGFRKVEGAVSELYRVMVLDGSMNGYEYKCEVCNRAGSVKSRSARLTVVYRILGGARSNWVKSSGSGLVFQGSGAYREFSGVSVDGSRISASEYSKGGSQTPFTEITLLRSYLETLSEGDHEVEIVWSDGSAKTSFCIVAPAADLPADRSGLGMAGTGTAGSSRAPGTTAAATDGAAGSSGMADSTGAGKGQAESADRDGEEADSGQISENALDESLSENTVESSRDKVENIFPKSDIPTGRPKEMTVIPGRRRMEAHSSDYEKSPMQLARMSETVNQYAGTVCLAVILISAAGIASGIITRFIL